MAEQATRRRKGAKRDGFFARLAERLSFGATLVAVSAVAIFIGWLVGQYAIRTVTDQPVGTLPLPSELMRSAEESVETASSGSPAPGMSAQNESPAATTTPTQTQSSSTSPASTAATTPASSRTGTAATSTSTTTSTTSTTTPAATSTSAASGSSSGGLWRVQAGAFSDRARAEALVDQLRAHGYEAFVSSSAPFRVQVGAFSDPARARALVDELHSLGFEAIPVAPN